MDLERLLQNTEWLRSLALALARDAHDAEDLVQETWIAALRSPPAVTDESATEIDAGAVNRSTRAWLRRVVSNAARLHWRRDVRRRAREEVAATSEAIDGPDDAAERAELLERILTSLLALPKPDRTIVLWRYFDGESTARIAARLDINPGAARMRLSRALARIRAELGDDGNRRLRTIVVARPSAAARPASAGAASWAALLIAAVSLGFAGGWSVGPGAADRGPAPLVEATPVSRGDSADLDALRRALEDSEARLAQSNRTIEALAAEASRLQLKLFRENGLATFSNPS